MDEHMLADWTARIGGRISAGQRMERVRVVTEPHRWNSACRTTSRTVPGTRRAGRDLTDLLALHAQGHRHHVAALGQAPGGVRRLRARREGVRHDPSRGLGHVDPRSHSASMRACCRRASSG
ncbi:DUF6879 family protein [Sphaerisporangium viridialbum]|uniref:DUF6879 family protein n=1 Tax=Sphaerisporangium viridialbum TaxID=46189 RepID=UPI003C78DC10